MKAISIDGYKVTSDGRVWSDKRKKFLKASIDHKGYYFLHLAGKNVRIHRLVAMAYTPNPLNHRYVNHIDYDKSNNCSDNLEWCSASENMKHAYVKGRTLNRGNGKFTPKQILDIRELVDSGASINSVAKLTGSSWDTINRISMRKAWKNI